MTPEDEVLARSFGDVAADYDRWRPSYPSEAIDWIVEQVDGDRAAEIGAGTGKATQLFLDVGLSVDAVEPDPAMIEQGRRRAPGATWIESTATEWAQGESVPRFDLVVGAQSWHWVPESADHLVGATLSSGGGMAWMWNRPDVGQRREWFGDLYDAYMPAGLGIQARDRRRDDEYWRRRLAKICRDVVEVTFSWSEQMDSDAYVGMAATFSDHIVLEPDRRWVLLDAIADRIHSFGGTIEVGYATKAFLGRAPDRQPSADSSTRGRKAQDWSAVAVS